MIVTPLESPARIAPRRRPVGVDVRGPGHAEVSRCLRKGVECDCDGEVRCRVRRTRRQEFGWDQVNNALLPRSLIGLSIVVEGSSNQTALPLGPLSISPQLIVVERIRPRPRPVAAVESTRVGGLLNNSRKAWVAAAPSWSSTRTVRLGDVDHDFERRVCMLDDVGREFAGQQHGLFGRGMLGHHRLGDEDARGAGAVLSRFKSEPVFHSFSRDSSAGVPDQVRLETRRL